MPDPSDGEIEDPSHHNSDHASPSDRELSPSLWHQAPIYQRYWRHHQQVWAWFRQHDIACRQSTAGASNSMLQMVNQQRAYHQRCVRWLDTWQNMLTPQHAPHHTPQPAQHHKPHRHSHGTRKRKAGKRHGHRKKTCVRSNVDDDTQDSLPTEDIGDSVTAESEVVEMQMEFTPAMVDFFAQSAKHRQERDAKKSAGVGKNGATKEEYMELGKENASHKASVAPPTERPGVKRTAEMHYLYGKGAAMIHGMETAMQLNFDRNTDRKSPKMWPNLPLNIIFT